MTNTTTEIPHEAQLLALHDALRKLERDHNLKGRFNLFEALSVTKQETTHSRFLAYLLDPQETHGLGDVFLRGVLMAAADGHPQLPVNRLMLSIRDLSDATVHCERDQFDITVQIPSLELLFVIENKVDAAQSEDQLKKYRLRAQALYPGFRFMGCFLTPDGYEGEDELWGTLSYVEIVDEARAIMGSSTAQMDVLVALKHYVELIERKIVTSPALIEACREIYRAHKTAFDLVALHGEQSLVALAFARFAEDHPHLVTVHMRSRAVFFMSRAWRDIPLAQVADYKRWNATFPVLFWFEQDVQKLHFRMEVGPIAQELVKQREVLVQTLKESFNGAKGKVYPTYTRVRTKSEKLPEDPTVDDLHAAMQRAWKEWCGGTDGTTKLGEVVRDWALTLPDKGFEDGTTDPEHD